MRADCASSPLTLTRRWEWRTQVTNPAFDRVYASLPNDGWLSEREARCLWSAALSTQGPILECGCYYGRSSVLLASLGRPLYCVDPLANFNTDDPSGDRIEAGWRANLAAYPNATLFRQRIEEWTPQPVGLAYLDGDHTRFGTLRQVEIALQCQPQIIAIHDVNDDGLGIEVEAGATRLLGCWNWRVERLAVWEVNR